jgi:hypothetical protein
MGIEPISSKYRGMDTYCATYTNAGRIVKNEKNMNENCISVIPSFIPDCPIFHKSDRAILIFKLLLVATVYNHALLYLHALFCHIWNI